MPLQSLGAEQVHPVGRPAALPADGVVGGQAGGSVPDHRGLPLVGKADGRDIPGVHAGLGDDLHHHRRLGAPDLHGVVLYPALPGVELGQLLLGKAQNVLLCVKEDGTGAGGALVESQNVISHFLIQPFVETVFPPLTKGAWMAPQGQARTHLPHRMQSVPLGFFHTWMSRGQAS